jgi:hypothetical protein
MTTQPNTWTFYIGRDDTLVRAKDGVVPELLLPDGTWTKWPAADFHHDYGPITPEGAIALAGSRDVLELPAVNAGASAPAARSN